MVSGYVAVVGSRSLPGSWASRVGVVVSYLLGRGWGVGSGGASGADFFALSAVVSAGASACSRSVVCSAWSSLASFRGSCLSVLSSFLSLGGSVVWGPVPSSCPRSVALRALFGRSRSLVRGSAGVVAFLWGRSAGSLSSVRLAVRWGLPCVVFVCGGGASLPSLPGGRWVRLSSGVFAGSYRWVSDTLF